MSLEVQCYSGRKADERPVRFRVDEHDHMVEEVLDQWYGPDHLFFKVRTADGEVYVLSRENAPDGGWAALGSFRASGRSTRVSSP